MALYAWSNIIYTKPGDEKAKPVSIPRGTKVTKSDFPGISEDDWRAMLESGSIRDKSFPAPDDYQGSALDYLRDQLAEAQAVSPLEEEEAVVELAAVERAAETEPEAPKEEPKQK